MKTIRILLADDHTVVRKGLRLLLEGHPGFVVVADAADGRAAVALADQHTPDVVVMDVAMPGLNGIEAARQISAKMPQVAVVFLSMHSDESYVLKALKSGARGYLLKDSAEQDLINAVIAVSEGKAFFSPAISKMLVEDYVRQTIISNPHVELLYKGPDGTKEHYKPASRALPVQPKEIKPHPHGIELGMLLKMLQARFVVGFSYTLMTCPYP